MKIVFCGTQCNGKTTLVENFKHNWPMYKTPSKSYREMVKEKNLNLNQQGDTDSQRIIRDVLLDQVLEMAGEKNVVYDRSVIDNIAYTLYGVEKGRIKDSSFIAESLLLCKETMKMVDIIFWLPLNPDIVITESENRDVDPLFRAEIDEIFRGIFDSYNGNDGVLFDPNDQPAMIALEGDVQKKIDLIAEYIGQDGDVIETKESILSTMEDEFEKLQIMNRLK
jgi:thymidylate kinase